MQDFFFLKTNGDFTRVDYSDIRYIEGLKNYVRIVTVKTVFIVLVTMKHIEEILPQERFCRVHRSYIVALRHISRFNFRNIIIAEKKIPISEQYRDVFMRKVVIVLPEPRNKIFFSKN